MRDYGRGLWDNQEAKEEKLARKYKGKRIRQG
jgi:hypothetical protein